MPSQRIGALQEVHVWTSVLDLEQAHEIPSALKWRFPAELTRISLKWFGFVTSTTHIWRWAVLLTTVGTHDVQEHNDTFFLFFKGMFVLHTKGELIGNAANPKGFS